MEGSHCSILNLLRLAMVISKAASITKLGNPVSYQDENLAWYVCISCPVLGTNEYFLHGISVYWSPQNTQ